MTEPSGCREAVTFDFFTRLNRGKIFSSIIAAALVLWLSARAPAVEPEAKGGPSVLTTAAGLKLEVHSAIHLDYVGFDREEENIKGVSGQNNDFMIRRARLLLNGKFDNGVGFYLQGGFEISDYPFLDAVVIIPVTDGLELLAGQLKAPFSQERLNSYIYQRFLERSLAANLELRRTQGIVLHAFPGEGAVNSWVAITTGENLNQHNTDDDFEYVGRVVLNYDKMFEDFPGRLATGFSAAYGRRAPELLETKSFRGKTMNEFLFFSPVPVDGYRTRYEADLNWRWRTLWLAGEIIASQEERNSVTVDLDTNADNKKDDTVTLDLDPLQELGWMVSLVWMLTGEDADTRITPAHDYGAWGLVFRYSTITFDSSEDRIPGSAAGVWGREVSTASEALGRPSIDETVSEFMAGVNWDIHNGVFIQFATVWQWFDYSSPYLDDRRSDVNYRGRIGVCF